jgi:FkbM family methyltransferase
MHPAVRNILYDSAKTIAKPLGLYPFPKTYGRHLLDTLRRLQINCVLDVGAHYGEWGQSLREIGYRGTIISFEPVRASCERLQKTTAGDSNWHILPFALGSEDSTALIHLYKSSDFNSFLQANSKRVEDRFAHNADDSGTETVTVKKLDSVFSDLDFDKTPPRIYLKIDTQGYDKNVVQGAVGSLSHVVAMQSEIPGIRPLYFNQPDMIETLAYYRSLGFAPTGFFPLNLERDNTTVIEFDVVLARFQLETPGLTPRTED